MQTVILKQFVHRNIDQLGLFFEAYPSLNNIVKRIKGIKWSKTHHCWYLPFKKEYCDNVLSALNGVALVDTTALKIYLHKRQTVLTINIAAGARPTSVPKTSVTFQVSDQNLAQLKCFVELLQLAGKSTSTIKTYKNEFTALLLILKENEVEHLTPDHLRRYMLYCVNTLKLSANTLNSRLNALKFYFEQVLHREKFFFDLPRPQRPVLLPNVLAEKEMGRLFNAIQNKKHKAILFTAYSAGLRVSEVTRLKLTDIDAERMQLFIESAKGNKDRFVMLSPIVLDVLRNYVKDQKPRPVKYVFEGMEPGEAYSMRSAQQIFNNAKRMAGIKKKITFHGLRHSFATHLLEKVLM